MARDWSRRSRFADGTGLVAAMLVNNEVGTIQPVAALADAAHRAGAWMLCDAVQAMAGSRSPKRST